MIGTKLCLGENAMLWRPKIYSFSLFFLFIRMMLYCVYSGESLDRGSNVFNVPIKNIIKSKNTLENHVQNFYKDIVEYFSEYGEGLAPKNLSEIAIRPVNGTVSIEFVESRNVKITITPDYSWPPGNIVKGSGIELAYGVSGGLHLDLSVILIHSLLGWNI